VNRILWNTRGDDIDEIVLNDVATVHIEQMSDGCWWIGMSLNDGGWWSGYFHPANPRSRTRLTFTEQERGGFEWDRDDSHDEAEA
jgi:hypothetical protein